MQLSHTQQHKPLAISMTPMIDIVFLLIIFFITCSQVSEANRMELDLPRLIGTEDQAQSQIIANIDARGQLSVSTDPVTVPEFIAICMEEARISVDNDPSRLTIVIRADRRGTCRTVNELVDALTRLGVAKVRFAVLSEP